MAESVDALVSNTSGATRAGSTPAPGTTQLCKRVENQQFTEFFFSPVLRFGHIWSRFVFGKESKLCKLALNPLPATISTEFYVDPKTVQETLLSSLAN